MDTAQGNNTQSTPTNSQLIPLQSDPVDDGATNSQLTTNNSQPITSYNQPPTNSVPPYPQPPIVPNPIPSYPQPPVVPNPIPSYPQPPVVPNPIPSYPPPPPVTGQPIAVTAQPVPPGKKFPVIPLIVILVAICGFASSFAYTKINSPKNLAQSRAFEAVPTATEAPAPSPTIEVPDNLFVSPTPIYENPFLSPTPTYENPFAEYLNPFAKLVSAVEAYNEAYQNPFEEYK
jgi:hypothetical protein